jgi:sialidase-1
VLFCNPAVKSDTPRWFDGGARRLLTVRLSTDGCRSWPVSRVLNEGGSGYSDLDVAADGTVLCLYEASEPGASHSRGLLRLARFSLLWLRERG